MSGLSHHLHSSQTGAPVCDTQAKEKGCGGALEGLERPEFWTRDLGLQVGFQDPSYDGPALVTSDQIPPSSPSALANGLHLQRRLGHSSCRRRQTDTHTPTETLRNMQTHIDPDVHTQAFSHAHMDNCGRMDINTHTGSVGPEQSKTLPPEAIHTTSSQPLSLALGNQLATDTFCPVPTGPNTGSSPLPVETEKKYALRSSGRPRFPCHLRKSSRLRRSVEDVEKRAGRERAGEEEDEVLEDKIWRVKEEEVAVGDKEENLTVEAVLPTATCHTDIPLSLTVPKPVPKAIPKPGPRLGHKPGPKSRCKPGPKPVHKAAPKSIMKQRQAAQAMQQRATAHLALANTSTIPASLRTVKEEPITDLGLCPPNSRRRGRFVGVSEFILTKNLLLYVYIECLDTLQLHMFDVSLCFTGETDCGQGGSDSCQPKPSTEKLQNFKFGDSHRARESE